jgi:hypothetical protein
MLHAQRFTLSHSDLGTAISFAFIAGNVHKKRTPWTYLELQSTRYQMRLTTTKRSANTHGGLIHFTHAQQAKSYQDGLLALRTKQDNTNKPTHNHIYHPISVPAPAPRTPS